LPSKGEALSANFSATKKKKKNHDTENGISLLLKEVLNTIVLVEKELR
jgi:hypothetical protein